MIGELLQNNKIKILVNDVDKKKVSQWLDDLFLDKLRKRITAQDKLMNLDKLKAELNKKYGEETLTPEIAQKMLDSLGGGRSEWGGIGYSQMKTEDNIADKVKILKYELEKIAEAEKKEMKAPPLSSGGAFIKKTRKEC